MKTALCRKNGSSYLPAIKIQGNGRTYTIKIPPKNSFLGYCKKEAAIAHAQSDINSMDFEDYR